MTPVSRTDYFSGQYLRTADFVDEQRYHLDMRRRHNIANHRFGIIAGLELIEEEGAVYLTSGMAVDGYGRELLVAAREAVGVEQALLKRSVEVLEVWLAYALQPADDAPEGYATCVIDDETTYRVIERPIVRFTAPDLDEKDRRCPATVPDDDCPFPPQRTPPDDPIDDWPVYLATITKGNEDDELSYTIDGSGRAYAGLVGEEIVAPSGRARVQVGAERRDDPFRFAIRLPELDDDQKPEVPRLAVDVDGGVTMVGQTAFLGNVAIDGALEIEAGSAIPAGQQPWTMYRVPVDSGSELRIEMDDASGDSVVIGSWNADEERFEPCLTIASDCTVTVHGDLFVEGAVRRPTPPGPQFTEEAQAVMTASLLGGLTGAAGLLPGIYESPFSIPIHTEPG